MMKNFIYLLSCFMLISMTSQAQHNHHERCGHNHVHETGLANNPNAVQKIESIERFTQGWIANNQHQASNRSVITIPIVFHVVWNDPIENISMAQIQSQIDVLNTDFRKQNPDTTFIPSVFQSLATDTEIQFCLAQRNPNGGPTDGVNRIQTTIDQVGNFDTTLWQTVAPLWDTSSYLNIYVCDIGGGLLGYATSPGNSYSGLDGIVMDYQYFGTVGTATASAPYDLGRTLTHEVGHYLNLAHLWGSNGGGCSDDDGVSDTPTQDGPNYGCNTHPLVSCLSADMFMNYMDYGEDACLVMFSQGQKMRMLAALNGPRAGLLSSTACTPFIQTIWHVNHAATGANDGTSWTNAFTDLNDALNVAQPYDEVWVAEGTYIPGNVRAATFNMADSVGLYGGFNGTETERSQRDYIANETILSGDIFGNDIAGDVTANRIENSFHIMYVNSDVDHMGIVDGFTFTGGTADGLNFEDQQGGGISSDGGPSILNCVFKENYGIYGGAMSISSLDLFFGIPVSPMTVLNCDFLDNVSEDVAGAVEMFGRNVFYQNCYFSGNRTAGTGGALNFSSADFEVIDCLFENNTAGSAGAISASLFATTSLNITNCDFIENHATDISTSESGGGAIINSGATLDIQSTIFDGNTSVNYAGAIYNEDGITTITNSLITNNKATGLGLGGAIVNKSFFDSPELTITNSTIANNYGITTGGIYQIDDNFFDDNYEHSPIVQFSNTILSNYNNNYGVDTATALAISLLGNISSDSSLTGVFTHIADMSNTNPMFRDTTNNDFHLDGGSPAHDLGVMAYAPMYDLDSVQRVGHPDAGAYEYPFAVFTEETISISDDVTVYPNPTSDVLNIEISDDWSGEMRFQLIDMTGRMIKTWSNEKYGDVYQGQISTKELPSGLYQIVITEGKDNKVIRFSKI